MKKIPFLSRLWWMVKFKQKHCIKLYEKMTCVQCGGKLQHIPEAPGSCNQCKIVWCYDINDSPVFRIHPYSVFLMQNYLEKEAIILKLTSCFYTLYSALHKVEN